MNKDQLEALLTIAQGKPIPQHIVAVALERLLSEIPLLVTDLQEVCEEEKEKGKQEGRDISFSEFSAAHAMSLGYAGLNIPRSELKRNEIVVACAVYMLLHKCDFAQALQAAGKWLEKGAGK